MAENNSGSGPQNATTGTISTNDTARPLATPPIDLEAITARAEAAAPGEWRSRRHGKNFSITSGLPGSMVVVCDVFDDTPTMGGTAGQPDADFIAAARSDVPALLAEVERLQKQHYDEVVDHAACMSIAEWAPIEGFVPTRASHRAVLAMRADCERLRAALRKQAEWLQVAVALRIGGAEKALEAARAALGEP